MEQKLKIAGQFDIEGTVSGIAPVGNGLINDTYSVTTAETNTPDYILQRINHHIFKDVELLQRNIQRVTDHIRAKLEASGESDIDRKALKLVPAKDGKLYHFDGENYWRMTVMIPRSVTHETMTPALAEQTGMALQLPVTAFGPARRGIGRNDPEFPQHRIPGRGLQRVDRPR